MVRRPRTIPCEACGQEVWEGETMYLHEGTLYCPECFRTLVDDMDLNDLAGEMGVRVIPIGPQAGEDDG